MHIDFTNYKIARTFDTVYPGQFFVYENALWCKISSLYDSRNAIRLNPTAFKKFDSDTIVEKVDVDIIIH